MPRELPPPGASRHPPHEDGGGMKTADAVALYATMARAQPSLLRHCERKRSNPLPATTRVIASSRSLLAMTSRTMHTFLLLSRNRGERSSLFLIPPTFVGRVAHREHCEGCVGWGAVSCLASYPHPALRATPERASLVSTPQGEGRRPQAGRGANAHTSAFSPRISARVMRCTKPSEIQRAQGMPGARRARSLACKIKKHTSVVTTVTPDHPAFPAQWFYDL
jgi:hypothetical protein